MNDIISLEPALKYINFETNNDDEGFLDTYPNLRKLLPKLEKLREKTICSELNRMEERRALFTKEELLKRARARLNKRRK